MLTAMGSPRSRLARLRRRFPRLASAARWIRPGVLRRRLRFLGKDRGQVFTQIYEKKLWDSSESVSGAGSTLQATESLRAALPEVLASLGVRSLLDAPCGDYYWMSQLDLDLDRYVGGEIVQALVDRLNREHGDARRSFIYLDIAKDALPAADALLCRDCLLHLSNDEVCQVLGNFRRSSCTYLLTSTYPDCTFNATIRTGMSRPVNLCLPPFGLPEPLNLIADSAGEVEDKFLGVWDLRPLRQSS